MAKIALLGGAFDPPHNGHLAVARAVRDARQLDRVDLLISAGSPHRGGKQNVASAADRAAMAALAVENEIGLGVEECELARPGPSFTVDTIRQLHSLRPQNQYSFILGGDMLADLPNWREIEALLDMVEFICVYRPGFGAEVFARLENTLGRAVVARLRASHVDVPQLGISSTKVRNAVSAGESIAQYVPHAVEQFIYARGLYRPA